MLEAANQIEKIREALIMEIGVNQEFTFRDISKFMRAKELSYVEGIAQYSVLLKEGLIELGIDDIVYLTNTGTNVYQAFSENMSSPMKSWLDELAEDDEFEAMAEMDPDTKIDRQEAYVMMSKLFNAELEHYPAHGDIEVAENPINMFMCQLQTIAPMLEEMFGLDTTHLPMGCSHNPVMSS